MKPEAKFAEIDKVTSSPSPAAEADREMAGRWDNSYPNPKADYDDLLTPAGDGDPFHILAYTDSGESKDKPVRQLKCLKCGGVEFHVAEAYVMTALRCVACRWEYVIHEG